MAVDVDGLGMKETIDSKVTVNFECDDEFKEVKIQLKNDSIVTERIYRSCPLSNSNVRIVKDWNEGGKQKKTMEIVYEYGTDPCCSSVHTCSCPSPGIKSYQFPSFEITGDCESMKEENVNDLVGNELMKLYDLHENACVWRKPTKSKWYVKLNTDQIVVIDDDMSVTVDEGETINEIFDSGMGKINWLEGDSHARMKREAPQVDCDYLKEATTTMEPASTPVSVNCDYHATFSSTPEPTTEPTTVEPTTTPLTNSYTSTTTIEPTTESTTVEPTTVETTTASTTTVPTTEGTTTEPITTTVTSTTTPTTTVTTTEPTTTTTSTTTSTSSPTSTIPVTTTSTPSTVTTTGSSSTVSPTTTSPTVNTTTTVTATTSSTTVTTTPSTVSTTSSVSTSTSLPSQPKETTGSAKSSIGTGESNGENGKTTSSSSTSQSTVPSTATTTSTASASGNSSSTTTSTVFSSSPTTGSSSSSGSTTSSLTVTTSDTKTMGGNKTTTIMSHEGLTTSTLRSPTTSSASLHGETTEEMEISICDIDVTLTTLSTTITPKNCIPSMFNLNISANENIPTVVREKNTVVGSNLPENCPVASFVWIVGEENVTVNSPHSLAFSLAIDQISHICLKVDSRRACGYITYIVPTSSSPFPTTASTSHVTVTVDPAIETIHKGVVDLVNGYKNGTNGSNLIENIAQIKDPKDFMESLTKALQEQLDLSNGGKLTTKEVIDMVKKYINTENDDVAKAMAILMAQLSNVTITDTATLTSILHTLDAALKGSLSYSLTGDGKALANVYGVIFGTIKGPKVNLMSAKCIAQVQGNVIYMKGDIRSAKYQEPDQIITINNYIRQMEITELQSVGFSAKVGISPFENYTIAGKRQLFKIIGDTEMMVGSGKIEPESGLCLWNCTFDPFGETSQSMINMTFTSWANISTATLTIPLSPITLKSLRLGEIVPSTSLKISAEFDNTNNVLTYLGGNIQLMEMNANYISIAVTGGYFDSTLDIKMKDVIVDPVRIEGISTEMLLSMESQTGKTQTTMDLTAAKGYTMMLITGFNDVSPLPVTKNATDSIKQAWFRSMDISMTKDTLENNFVAGNSIQVTGQIETEQTGITSYHNVFLNYDGTRILVDTGDKKMVIEDATWKTSYVSYSRIVITGGYLTADGMDHTQTILELSEKSRIVIDRGTIIRNATDGYVIMNGQITKIGEDGGNLEITPQSLMNQDAQKEIIKILDNTADFLLLNGKNMTDAEIAAVAKSLLSIFGSINKAIADALANPLASDLAKNLALEKANYDDIFNSLPKDSSKIRYVEEYTQEEWAAEATRLVQQQIARQMAAQMERVMGILEDTLVDRMTTLPGHVSYEMDGNSMVVTVGRADEVLKEPHMCTQWTIVFPERVEYLNTQSIKNETIIRVSLICYEINPYAYVDNAAVLVSSGALSASLKTREGIVIDVNQTTDPISITGLGGGKPSGSTLMLTSDYLSYQILDVHTFHTVQWNSSVVVEISPAIITNEDDSGNEIWVFVGFQRLPGPHEKDHDFKFKIDKTRKSSLFISSWDLFNRTGLFYVGMGIRSVYWEENKPIVEYPIPSDINGSWNFVRSINYDYRMRAITKGCFYFVMHAERWDSSGLKTGVYVGDKMIQCLTYHMTYYAGGIYTPPVPGDFDYKYVEQSFPKSCLVFLAFFLIIVHQGAVMWMANRHTKRDRSKGQLHVMADNHPLDTYKYILVVDTGFNMFATTDSEVHVNIVGDEWQTVDRILDGKDGMGKGMKWGTTERFLLATKYPLGKLKYLSIWIDCVGLQHRESWFCNRIIVYDLQNKDEFLFKVDNWLGTQNGDGKTERTVGVSHKPSTLREATWGHRLFENVAYIAMYTGGGTIRRLRVTRPVYAVAVYIGMFTVCFINILMAQGEDFSTISSYEKNVLGFHFCPIDVVLGALYALLLLPFTIILPLLYSFIKSDVEAIRMWKLNIIEKKRGFMEPTGQYHYGLKSLANTCIFMLGMAFIFLSIHKGFSMDQDENNAFGRRFFLMLVLWIFIIEPLKGIILTLLICAFRREHYYISRFERSFMRILPREAYPIAPDFDKDEEENAKKLVNSKSLRSEDQRMRDEQLFTTTRQVITFFASIFVLLGLTYFCRDRYGFFYQKEVTNLFSLNGNPYDGKSFQGIRTIEHFYNWTTTKLVPGLRVSWYDKQPAWDMRGFMNDKTSRSMGYGIIRQVRSKLNVNCKIADKFLKYFDSCEGLTGRSNEDMTEAYTVGWAEVTTKNSNFTRQEYTYRSDKELQGSMIIGNMDNYNGGGYAWDIVGTASDLTEQMNRLQKEGWVDENTRAIIIEFSMYNAQVNYFAVIQLVLENPPDGAFYPYSWIETVRLMKYVGEDGKYVRAFEALYVLFAVVTLFFEIYELGKVGLTKYFTNFWHILGFLVVICSSASLYAYGMRFVKMEEASDRFMATNGNTYIRLDSQRDFELYFTWLMGFVVFAVSIQMIRILRFNRRISVLALTLEKSAASIGGFALVYILINLAFDSALYTLLYNKLHNYRNFLAVMEATTASLLGKFSVNDVLAASTLGSIMFMIFMMTGTIVLVNMFVMIVMYEFENVRNDKNNQTNEYEVVQHISSKLLQTVGLFERSDNPNTAFPNYLQHCRAIELLEKQVNQLDLLVENMREVDDEDVEEAKKGECQRKMYSP